jgi:hypothetical protein
VTELTKRQAELLCAWVILAFSLIMLWVSQQLEHGAVYPRTTLIATAFFALVVMITASRNKHRDNTDNSAGAGVSTEKKSSCRLLLLIVAPIVYFGLWPVIGYVLSSLLFMIGLLSYFKYPLVKGIVVSVVVTLTINVVFKTILQVPLPTPDWLSWIL